MRPWLGLKHDLYRNAGRIRVPPLQAALSGYQDYRYIETAGIFSMTEARFTSQAVVHRNPGNSF